MRLADAPIDELHLEAVYVLETRDSAAARLFLRACHKLYRFHRLILLRFMRWV
jgi:hypothetical protein